MIDLQRFIFFSGSPTWIRTKTNRVRVCCATVTQSDYFFVSECNAKDDFEKNKIYFENRSFFNLSTKAYL